MNQLERVHWQRSKLEGPGRVTEWVNKHHTESNRIIDDKIKSVEGSLASKGTGESGIPPRYGERKITDEEYKALRKKHRQQK